MVSEISLGEMSKILADSKDGVSSHKKVPKEGAWHNVSDLLENRQIDRPFFRRVARCDYNCKICSQGRFIQFCISRSVPPLFTLRMRSGNQLASARFSARFILCELFNPLVPPLFLMSMRIGSQHDMNQVRKVMMATSFACAASCSTLFSSAPFLTEHAQ